MNKNYDCKGKNIAKGNLVKVRLDGYRFNECIGIVIKTYKGDANVKLINVEANPQWVLCENLERIQIKVNYKKLGVKL